MIIFYYKKECSEGYSFKAAREVDKSHYVRFEVLLASLSKSSSGEKFFLLYALIFYCEEVQEKKKDKQSWENGSPYLISAHIAHVELNSEGYLFAQLTEILRKELANEEEEKVEARDGNCSKM